MHLHPILFLLPILLLAACQPNSGATAEDDPTAEPTIEVTAEPTETPAPLPNYTPIDLESVYSMTGRILQVDPASLPTVADPVFVNHDAPAITFDRTSLEAAGCTFDEFDGVSCPANSPIASLPCSSVSLPGDLLGALSGDVTLVARCQQIATEPDAQAESIYKSGCMLLQQNIYLVEFQGYIVQIGSAEAFRTNFAPIEDADEALSYALALTGLIARYDVAPTDGLTYFTDHIEDTYVQQVEDSYLVHLWHQEICGCSPFMASQVDVLVHPDGALDWLGAIPTWLDDTRQICVD
jgi:hypothetical protein